LYSAPALLLLLSDAEPLDEPVAILMFPRKKQEQQSATASPSETGGRGANGGVGMGDCYYRLEKIQVVANT